MNRLSKEEIIKRALEFPMHEVVLRYAEETNLPPEVVEEHERELKRYLAMLAITGKPYLMAGPIDKLWHVFILHTRQYAAFCEELGSPYIHHHPGRKLSTVELDALDARTSEELLLFASVYESTFNEVPPEHLWPGARQLELGSRAWWIGQMRRAASGQISLYGSTGGGTSKGWWSDLIDWFLGPSDGESTGSDGTTSTSTTTGEPSYDVCHPDDSTPTSTGS